MMFSARPAIRSGLALLAVSLLPQTLSGWCAVRTILVQGRVEDAARGASVTVELLYEHGQVGESDRLVLEGPTFRTRIAFSTGSSSTEVLGHALSRCKRSPKSVAVVLLEDDQEVDRVTLGVPRDFTAADPSELAVRSAVVLHGTRAGVPQK